MPARNQHSSCLASVYCRSPYIHSHLAESRNGSKTVPFTPTTGMCRSWASRASYSSKLPQHLSLALLPAGDYTTGGRAWARADQR